MGQMSVYAGTSTEGDPFKDNAWGKRSFGVRASLCSQRRGRRSDDHQSIRDSQAEKGIVPIAGWGDSDYLPQGLVRVGHEEDTVVEEETPGNNRITCRSEEFSFGVLSRPSPLSHTGVPQKL